MARLRKAVAYRRLERPYTRISKYKKKSFIRTRPNIHIVKYDMGDPNGKFGMRIDLVSTQDFQARHNSIEASRQTTNRLLEKVIGKKDFHFKVRVYPHHILRENPLASGAGADRMSTGMSRSFGKAIGTAARIRKGQAIFSVYCNKTHLDTVKKALKRANQKFAVSCRIKENILNS